MDETIMEKPVEHIDEIQKLVKRAQEGDLTCVPALKALLEEKPELWKSFGDLAEHAEMSLLDLLGKKNLFAREAIKLNHRDLKASLTNPNASPLEKLLVQRICVSYLQVYQADLDAADAVSKGEGPRSVYAQRRLDSAQKRYLQAIKQLAMVRKLLKTAPVQAKPESNADGTVKKPRGRPRKNSTESGQKAKPMCEGERYATQPNHSPKAT